jgi:hypothetical protein
MRRRRNEVLFRRLLRLGPRIGRVHLQPLGDAHRAEVDAAHHFPLTAAHAPGHGEISFHEWPPHRGNGSGSRSRIVFSHQCEPGWRSRSAKAQAVLEMNVESVDDVVSLNWAQWHGVDEREP